MRSVTVKPSAGDVTGRLLSGQLTLKAPSKRACISGEGLICLSELENLAQVSSSTFWSSEFQPADAGVELALTYVHFRREYHRDDHCDWEMEMKSLVLNQMDSDHEHYERIATFSIFSRFRAGQSLPQAVLQTFALEMNEDTRQVTGTQRTCYREFKIV